MKYFMSDLERKTAEEKDWRPNRWDRSRLSPQIRIHVWNILLLLRSSYYNSLNWLKSNIVYDKWLHKKSQQTKNGSYLAASRTSKDLLTINYKFSRHFTVRFFFSWILEKRLLKFKQCLFLLRVVFLKKRSLNLKWNDQEYYY